MKLKQTGWPLGKGPFATYLRMTGPHRSRHSQVLTPRMWVIRDATPGLLVQTSRDCTS